MTHIRRDLTMTEARSYLKTALWDRHESHISQADHWLVTMYAQSLRVLTETREDIRNLSDSELTESLSVFADALHNNIAKGE